MKLFMSGLVYDGGKSGISQYLNGLTKALVQSNQITLALLEKDIDTFPVRHKNLEIVVVSNLFSHPVLSILWHMVFIHLYVLRSKAEAMVLPAINRRIGLFALVPCIGIVHDLSQYHIESKYDFFRTMYVKVVLPLMAKSCDSFIAISEATKTDVVKFWGLDEKRITVLYNGYDRNKYNCETPENIDLIKNKYRLNKPYFIYVSRIEHPGKNHLNLVKALESLPTDFANQFKIVFAGSDWNGAEIVKNHIINSPVASTFECLGFVPDEDLPALYHGAFAMVFPSFYEGFGMPVVESMACGIPTLCSKTPALSEVSGNAALKFDPANPDDIAQKLIQISVDESLRLTLAEAGKAQATNFDWNNLAIGIVRAINDVNDHSHKHAVNESQTRN